VDNEMRERFGETVPKIEEGRTVAVQAS